MLYDAPKNFRYDIALTFPGELRILAKVLEQNLKDEGLEVFCESDTAGKNTKTIVSDYAKEVVLIVPFFIKQYGYSDFCQQEWHSIKENWDILHDRVLPISFDDSNPGYGISESINLTASDKDITYITNKILEKYRAIKRQWSAETTQIQIAIIGERVEQTEEIIEAVRANLPGVPHTETQPDSTDKEEKNSWISTLQAMPGDLVMIVCPAASSTRRELHALEAVKIAEKRVQNFKRTLLLVGKKEKRSKYMSSFESLQNQPGIKVSDISSSSISKSVKLPDNAADYLSLLTGSIVYNVFFDDTITSKIKLLRRELSFIYSNKVEAIRWFNFNIIAESVSERSAMFELLSQSPPTRGNIYLISEDFYNLAKDGSGNPKNSTIMALLPRLVAYRTEEYARVKQSFMFVNKDIGERLLRLENNREQLKHYWRYAEPLLYSDINGLKARLDAALSSL